MVRLCSSSAASARSTYPSQKKRRAPYSMVTVAGIERSSSPAWSDQRFEIRAAASSDTGTTTSTASEA